MSRSTGGSPTQTSTTGLLTAEETNSFTSATNALLNRLDPHSRVLAAQEFRHAVQREDEPVAEYIRRLEQTYRKAYGRDRMSSETCDTLLFGQLQEGLKYALVKAPAVSGAQDYQQLCLAARNEERRLVELSQLHKVPSPGGANTSTPSTSLPPFSGNTVRCLTPAHGAHCSHKLLPTTTMFQLPPTGPFCTKQPSQTPIRPMGTSRPAHTNQVCLDTDPQLDPIQPGRGSPECKIGEVSHDGHMSSLRSTR